MVPVHSQPHHIAIVGMEVGVRGMRDMANGWAVVMAGGNGARLRTLTTTQGGLVIPKQYCSLGRSECLLQDAVKRAQSIVTPAHVCSVVAAQHRRWWTAALSN